MSDTEIHGPTLDACINALSWKMRVRSYSEPYSKITDDYYTFAGNRSPLDILESLRPAPELSEAEKLASEWATSRGYDFVTPGNVSLVEFVMQRLATPAKLPEPEPEYVFGRWIKHDGSNECPVPSDWEIETVCGRYESLDEYDTSITRANNWTPGQWEKSITYYRVRFEVGKWYDWTGGECPLPDDCRFEFCMRGGKERTYTRGTDVWDLRWNHTGWAGDIIAFRVVS